MRILVFTSSMIDDDFSSYQDSAKIKPNPSNQYFYSKLIQALAKNNQVNVVSLRPFVKGMFKEKVLTEENNTFNNINYRYTKVNSSKLYKMIQEETDIVKSAVEIVENIHWDDFVIVTDTLRINLIKAARKVGAMYGTKVIGMLTDNPENLSFKSKAYAKQIKHLVSNLDGYISLTNGLVTSFNPLKPHYVFEGLVKDEQYFRKDPIYDYYFFAGSLYERYGVKTLVDAFHQSSIKSKLVIAGSGPLSKYIEQLSNDDYRILYLSQLPKEKIIAYEKNSIANLNPRPLNAKLDKESVPSKLLEYLSIETPIITTKYEKFYGPFKDNLFWINGNDTNAILDALLNFEKTPIEVRTKKALSARNKAFEFYGLDVQGESISHFLASVNSSTNK